MHHVGAVVAGYGVIFPEINGLLRANLLAHAAVDAADHVDIEFLRELFHLGEAVLLGKLPGNDLDGARGTDEFAELASHAADSSGIVPDQSRRAAIMFRQL